MPKPPDTFCMAFTWLRAVLPMRNERVYSRSWKRGMRSCGGRGITILPSSTTEPLLMRMVADTAITRRVLAIVGQIIR